MQEFDALRHRVEATTQKLTAAQAERRDQTQSLVEILRQLEERHAAQEQQLAWYRDRVGPQEQANRQLVQLMENLLDLIDSGFGDDSLQPLRNASKMASAMLLANDLIVVTADPVADDTRQAAESDPAAGADAVRNFGMEDDRDGAAGPDFAGAPALDGRALEDFGPDDATAFDDEDDADGMTDLEMEEDALISLDQLLELASDDSAGAPVSFGTGNDAADAESNARFEDVSEAVLELEAREDAEAGFDDLPHVAQQAAAVTRADVPETQAMAAFDAVMDDSATEGDAVAATATADDVEELSALAVALEEGTGGNSAPAPAPSDIRALLLRVEALARKAEAMRLAQQPTDSAGKEKSGTGAMPRKTGAAA